jgi:hypothetical protein
VVPAGATEAAAHAAKGAFEAAGFRCHSPRCATGRTAAGEGRAWWTLLVTKPMELRGSPVDARAEVQLCDAGARLFLADGAAYEELRGCGDLCWGGDEGEDGGGGGGEDGGGGGDGLPGQAADVIVIKTEPRPTIDELGQMRPGD